MVIHFPEGVKKTCNIYVEKNILFKILEFVYLRVLNKSRVINWTPVKSNLKFS